MKGTQWWIAKKVIDTKVKEWLHDYHWRQDLCASTLLTVTNFENYLEQVRSNDTPVSSPLKPLEFDFNKGEM